MAPFPKSCPSYFRFARFNTFPLYYLRAWHRLVHTRRQVAATHCGDRSLHVYSSGDKLQQHGEATRRSNKSLRVHWRIFVKIFVFATKFCRCNKSEKNKIRLNLYDFLRRPNSVAATKIFTKILHYSRSDLSLRRVARVSSNRGCE